MYFKYVIQLFVFQLLFNTDPNPNGMWSVLPSKSNRFFLGSCTTFLLNKPKPMKTNLLWRTEKKTTDIRRRHLWEYVQLCL